MRRPWSRLDGPQFSLLDNYVSSLVLDEDDEVADFRLELLANVLCRIAP